jgi:hypothetical protein
MSSVGFSLFHWRTRSRSMLASATATRLNDQPPGRINAKSLHTFAHARGFGHLDAVIAAAHKRNMQVILSPHNYGRYYLEGNETLMVRMGCLSRPLPISH